MNRVSNSVLQQIADAIHSIRYGTISIVIQDAKVIQIERTEKVRLDKADQKTGDTTLNSP